MSTEQYSFLSLDPRMRDAVNELEGLIRQHYPEATFTVGRGHEPEGVYLTATVDVDDTDGVFDVVVDRLLELQIDEDLPIDVIPVRPIERVVAELREKPNLRSTLGSSRLAALGLPRATP